VLGAVEVARCDRRQTGLGDPAEQPCPVEELEAVSEPAQVGVVREAPGEPARRERRLAVERVRRDERGAGLCSRSHRLRDPAVDGDELSEPDGNDVGRLGGVVIVVGQFEPRDDQHPVRRPRARRFALDLGQMRAPGALVERVELDSLPLAPGVVRADDVVGDAQHVEAVARVQVDELGDAQPAVAPARVRVQLAEQGSDASRHAASVRARTAHVG
jgi:hypothetical protein